MSIPLNFSPLGFAQVSVPVEPSELPAGYARLAFLGATPYSNKQAMDTGLRFSSETELRVLVAVVQGSMSFPKSGVVAGNIQNTNQALNIVLSPGSGGAAIRWGSESTTELAEYVNFGATVYDVSNSKRGYYVNGVQCATWEEATWANTQNTIHLFVDKGWSAYSANNLRIYAASVSESDILQGDYLPAVDPAGAPGMFDKVTQTFLANSGSGSFTAGIETIEQLAALASNLPTVTGSPEIKLSLPGAWNGDAAANAQLSIITGKSWQATISYRDAETTASSSFVWGGRGDGAAARVVLWCKSVASESGNYQDETGNKYYIETCNDIWRSDGLTPDDLGYSAALDLASYLAENNLIPVEYPEEELNA